MGALVNLPRDTTTDWVTTYYCGATFYIAQFDGFLCPHYHFVKAEVVKCHRRMVRFFTRKGGRGGARRPRGNPRRLTVIG